MVSCLELYNVLEKISLEIPGVVTAFERLNFCRRSPPALPPRRLRCSYTLTLRKFVMLVNQTSFFYEYPSKNCYCFVTMLIMWQVPYCPVRSEATTLPGILEVDLHVNVTENRVLGEISNELHIRGSNCALADSVRWLGTHAKPMHEGVLSRILEKLYSLAMRICCFFDAKIFDFLCRLEALCTREARSSTNTLSFLTPLCLAGY